MMKLELQGIDINVAKVETYIIFCTFYCRLIDKSNCWRILAEKSLLRYKEIEDESGVNFYKEVGFLTLIDEKVRKTKLGSKTFKI